MQASSEALVHEEHQIGDPPLMSQHVRLCIALFVCLCITFYDLVLEEMQIGDPPLPPQGTCIFVDISIYIYFLCSLIVSKWRLKSTESWLLLVRHQDPPLLTHVQ